MGNRKGKEIDLYVIFWTKKGNGLYCPPERGEGMYPADAPSKGRELSRACR